MDILPVSAKFVPGTTDGKPSEDELAIINANSVKPYSADDLYCFACVMATNDLTDYGVRLGLDTLMNFAGDADRGVPYNLQHKVDVPPFGYTFKGAYDADSSSAMAAVYIPKGRIPEKDGRTSNQEISDLMSGMRREVSVGVGGVFSTLICDVCGSDMWGFDCYHVPGMKADGVMSTGTIHNGRLQELSGVSRGGCPGAIVVKAQEMRSQSKFSAKEFSGWCNKMGVKNPNVILSTPPIQNEETPKMRDVLIAALKAGGLTLHAEGLANIEDKPEALSSALAKMLVKHSEAAQASAEFSERLASYGVNSITELAAMKTHADFGAKYLIEFRAEGVKQGVRALGAENAGMIEGMVNSFSSPTMLQSHIDMWKKTGDAFAGLTDDGKPKARETVSSLPSPGSYAVTDPSALTDSQARVELLSKTALGRDILKREAK